MGDTDAAFPLVVITSDIKTSSSGRMQCFRANQTEWTLSGGFFPLCRNSFGS